MNIRTVDCLLEQGYKFLRGGAAAKDGCQVLVRRSNIVDKFGNTKYVTDFRKVSNGEVLDREISRYSITDEVSRARHTGYSVADNGGVGPGQFGQYRSGNCSKFSNGGFYISRSNANSRVHDGYSSRNVEVKVGKDFKVKELAVDGYTGKYDVLPNNRPNTYIPVPWRNKTSIRIGRDNNCRIYSEPNHPDITWDHVDYKRYYRYPEQYRATERYMNGTNIPQYSSFDKTVTQIGENLNLPNVKQGLNYSV